MSPTFHAVAEKWRHARRSPTRAAVRALQWAVFTIPWQWRVATGPFQGQRLVGWTPRMPYVLGTYEKEVLPFLQHASKHAGVKRLVDIGAADGYYAVGLARIAPQLRVLAFEAGEFRQATIRRAATMNGVGDRIDVGGWCDQTALAEALAKVDAGPSLVLCDIEGGEYDLLDPVIVPALLTTPILVEVHGDRGHVLQERFEASHEITKFNYVPREPEQIPVGRYLLCIPGGKAFVADAMDERRHDALNWFGMWPRDLPGGPACKSPS